jgi:hypothetical protein
MDMSNATPQLQKNEAKQRLNTLETKFFQVFDRDVGVGWRLKTRLRLQSPPSGTYKPTKVGFSTIARDFSRWAREHNCEMT